MKKKTMVGLIAIAAITAVVLFAGCIEEKAPENAPAGERPPSIPESEYSRGDLLRAEGQSSEYAYLILDYNEGDDRYQTTIVQLVNDKWTYTERPKTWNDRDYIERTLGVIKIKSIDPATVAPYTEEKAPSSTLTQIRIVDVDATIVGLSQIEVDMTIKNVGDVTAKNVIASVIVVSDEYIDDVDDRPSLLRLYTEDEMLCLDRDYLGDIEPDQYAKAKLLFNVGEAPEEYNILKVATADNAEAVCY
jgi:hypothetical protein